MVNNPEQRGSSQSNPIPDEWKSLIQDGIYNENHERTKEYEDSYFGQKELAEEKSAEFVEKRLEELEKQLRAGQISQERYDKIRDKYQEKYDKIVANIDAHRQDYHDNVYVGTPEEQAQYEEWLKSKDAENQANLRATGRASDSTSVEEIQNQVATTTETTTTASPEAQVTTSQTVSSSEVISEEAPSGEPDQTSSEATHSSSETDGSTHEAEGSAETHELTREDAQYLKDQERMIDEWQRQNSDLIDDELSERIKNIIAQRFVTNRMEGTNRNNADAETISEADIEAANEADIKAANEADIEAANEADKNDATETIDKSNKANTLDPAKSRELLNKSKAKRGFKAAIATLLAGVMLVGTLLIPGALPNKADVDNTSQPSTITQVVDATQDAVNNLGENQEATHGIYDGYYERGMYMSNQKDGQYSFAAAHEVAQEVGQDKCDVMRQVDHCMPEALADHLASLPDEVKDHYGLSEFDGLSILDTESRLENLSDEEYEDVLNKMDQVWEDAFTEDVVLNGTYQNAYMYTSASGDEAVTHNNTQLVECTTQENGTQATRFFWTLDGNGNSERIGDITAKIHTDSNGNIAAEDDCTQVVHEAGSTTIYVGMNTIQDNPPITTTTTNQETPTPDNPGTPETPPDGIQPKDPENLTRIDEQISRDIAEDIGTNQINITPNPGVSENNVTEQPSAEDFQGTEPDIVQNESTQGTTSVQGPVSESNNYSQDNGGANAGEYSPVQENQSAQSAADSNEIPINQAPTGGQELDETLQDLGIN